MVRRAPRGGSALSSLLVAAETTAALGIAHTAAGGERPSAGWLLVVAAMVYGASRLVLRRNLRIRVVLPALVGAQVLLHAWLVTLSGHGSTGHAASDGPLGLGWPMLAAHLAAGAVAALAWALRRRAVDVLLAWSEPTRPGPPRLRGQTMRHRGHAPRHRDLLVAPTRGPPAGVAAAA